MAEPKTVERKPRAFVKINWKRIRAEFLKRSVPIPAPIFFLIFLAISLACFSLYFKVQRTNALLQELEHRTEAIESHLQDYGGPDSEMDDGDEGYPEGPTSHIIEM